MNNEVPGVEVPHWILEKMKVARTKDEAQKIGVEVAHDMKTEIESNVAGIQVSAPFEKIELALDVLVK